MTTNTAATKYNARSAHGRVHILTAGRTFKIYGCGPYTNRTESVSPGKADCGALMSGAASLTDDPSNCTKCIAKEQS